MRKQTRYAKAKWAKVLGVSRSGYYTWLDEKDARESRQQMKVQKILNVYKEGEGHYGAERICGIIRTRGGQASFRYVRSVMKQHGLRSSHCVRRQRSLTDSRGYRGADLINLTHDLEIAQPFQVLTSDITYIRTREGFDYLCQVQDVHTNLILATTQQSRMTQDIVHQTIQKAKQRWSIADGTIFHTDRGSQYTAKRTEKLIELLGLKHSYSRVGKPGDNAWSESFFANMKKEIIHGNYYQTCDDARQATFEYIERYYNRKRVQKRLGYRCPYDYMMSFLDQQRNELKAVA